MANTGLLEEGALDDVVADAVEGLMAGLTPR
jgi:hypothetical protein